MSYTKKFPVKGKYPSKNTYSKSKFAKRNSSASKAARRAGRSLSLMKIRMLAQEGKISTLKSDVEQLYQLLFDGLKPEITEFDAKSKVDVLKFAEAQGEEE